MVCKYNRHIKEIGKQTQQVRKSVSQGNIMGPNLFNNIFENALKQTHRLD